MKSRRILITGLSSWWGGRLAQALERQPEVQAVIGIDSSDPRHALERTEFVRAELEPAVLQRIIPAARIDTVIDTRLSADPLLCAVTRAHEANVAGTRHLLEACAGTAVRKLVFKSSARYYGSSAEDPAFFSEDMRPTHPARTAIERDIVQAEGQLADFAARRPECTVTVLRPADPLLGEPGSSHLTLLSLPAVPAVLGFDPRWQFVHEDDLLGAFVHAVRHDLPGIYNVAGDGVLALSEVASLLGKPLLPILPPWGFGFAITQLRRLGLRVPLELVRELRHGRGLDNRRLKASGYHYRYTSREAALKLRAHQRLRPLLGSGAEGYRYDREVEEFLRRSPSVVAPAPESTTAAAKENGSALDQIDDAELIELIGSLDARGLAALRGYEQAHAGRPAVLAAIDRNLMRTAGDGTRPGESSASKQDPSGFD